VTARGDFIGGVRDAASPAGAAFVLAVSFGAEAANAHWGTVLPLFFSVFACSGSAQFALLTTLSTGSALAAVTSATLINARYLVMGIALNESLRGGRLWRALQAQALVDASFAMAHRGGGRFDTSRLFGATAVQWLGWVAGTALGLLLQPSPALLESVGADVVFPAFFLILVLEEIRSPRPATAAICGAVIAGAMLLVAQPGIALLVAISGALVGAVPTSPQPDPRDEGQDFR
jgi:4-azaleucine resistance transporter AzlC